MIFSTHNPCKFAFSAEEEDLEKIDINDEQHWGIIGVPFDSTVSYHVGSRYGPIVVREGSYSFEYYNLPLKTEINTLFYDFGDLNTIPGNCKKTCDLLCETVTDLLNHNICPILIGGEHSMSEGALRAIALNSDNNTLNDVTIIHFDAHRDLIDNYLDEKYSHATVMRRAFELGPNEIIQIGIRSSSLEEEEFVYNHNNIITFHASNVRENIKPLIEYIKSINSKIYISIDMDVLDPSFAPSLGNPVPIGLSPDDILEILIALKDKEIIGFDVMETATDKLGDITAITASKFIYDFLSLMGIE